MIPYKRDFVTLIKAVINYLPRCSYHITYFKVSRKYLMFAVCCFIFELPTCYQFGHPCLFVISIKFIFPETLKMESTLEMEDEHRTTLFTDDWTTMSMSNSTEMIVEVMLSTLAPNTTRARRRGGPFRYFSCTDILNH